MDLLEISKQAEIIAKKYNPDSFAPFPYEKIMEDKNDLDIFLIDFNGKDEVSGAIFYEKEKFKIFVNKTKPKTRQHFTIAHELGHYFLHSEIIKSEGFIIDGDNFLDGSKILYRLDKAQQDKIETEANNFAASLIMPEELTRKVWNKVENVEECAKIFQVSILAMSIRLERLKLIG